MGFKILNFNIFFLGGGGSEKGLFFGVLIFFRYFMGSSQNWTIVNGQVPGVQKHMKRFERLITFDSTKICWSLFLMINILYIEII